MKQETITINNQAIQCLHEENGVFIALHPICDALGIDWSAQRKRLMDDAILSSTVVMTTTVGADGKNREMVTLPLEYVFGWLFTIDTSRVKADAMEAVIRYKKECYETLYRHFITLSQRQLELTKQELAITEEKARKVMELSELRKTIREMDERLSVIHQERFNLEPTLF